MFIIIDQMRLVCGSYSGQSVLVLDYGLHVQFSPVLDKLFVVHVFCQ